MSGYDSNTRGRGFPAGTPAVEAVRHVPIHVSEDITLDVLIDFTDSHVMDFKGITILLTAQRLAQSEDRQAWLMGLPENAWTVLQAMGLADLFVRVSAPGEQPN